MKFPSISLVVIILLVNLTIYKVSAQTRLDSISVESRVDIFSNTSLMTDSVIFHSLDSIHGTFSKRTDSLKSTYNRSIGKLDSLRYSLRKERDNLTTRNIPESHIVEKLDSLTNLQINLTARFKTKLEEMKDQVSSKIADLNLPPELAEKTKAITGSINDVALSDPTLKLPGLEGFDDSLENLGGIGKLESINSSAVPTEIGSVQVPPGLNGTGSLTKPMPPPGNVTDVESLSEAAEQKATDISGIQEIEKQTGSLDQYKEAVSKPPDQDSLKEIAIAQLRQVAVNHFAGKEQVLQEAMETMTKYKNKYASVSSISELPKKRPNEMRGKSFIERIIPGLALQIHKEGDDFMVDFNAYAAYRFTRKINAGIGWNQRVAYNMNYNAFNADMRIFGPRIFGEYHLWKGFFPRAELELMNTGLPPITRGSVRDPLQREWVWGVFVGLKKEYRIIRNIKGTAMVLTRLFNPENKSPYADVLNVRFGFEFPTKKNSKAVEPLE